MARPRSPIAHGELKGARQHARYGVPLCDPCREAVNAYQRDYRRASPLTQRRSYILRKLRERAWARLASRHQDEYRECLREVTLEWKQGKTPMLDKPFGRGISKPGPRRDGVL